MHRAYLLAIAGGAIFGVGFLGGSLGMMIAGAAIGIYSILEIRYFAI